jgi:hypothetical protein
MGYFQVKAKCGHVGREMYYEGAFYVKANNGRAAAAVVRMKPRVKHDHKDAILAVAEVEYGEFKAGQASNRNNPYFQCRNKQTQLAYMANIEGDLRPETNADERLQRDKTDSLVKLCVISKYERKNKKYGHLNIEGA